MIYLAIVFGYAVLIAGLIRLFMVTHSWDDEIQEMERQIRTDVQHRAA